MSWILVNNTSYFTLTESGGEVHDIYPTDIRQLYLRGAHVWIVYTLREQENNDPTVAYGVNTLKLLASDFTSPTYASAALLKVGLLAIISTMSTATLLLDILAGINSLDSGYSVLLGKPSGGDFITSYNGATSLDCDSMPVTHPALITEDVDKVTQYDNTGAIVEEFIPSTSVIAVTNPAGSTYRITIATATFAATDTFLVYTNVGISINTTKILGTDLYAEGVTKGNVVAVVRNDAGDTLVDTDGEFTALQVNATGQLGINQESIRDVVIPIGAGNADGGTQRVIIADDDVNSTAINVNTTALTTNPTLASSTAYEASNVVKASAGTLYTISGYNSGAVQFVQVHNTTTLPADSAVPIVVFKIDALDNFAFDIGGLFGLTFGTGITICNSSTTPTKTIGAADCWFNITYK